MHLGAAVGRPPGLGSSRPNMAAAQSYKPLVDGELYVIVKEAAGLQACDSNGLSDPFVTMRLTEEVPTTP